MDRNGQIHSATKNRAQVTASLKAANPASVGKAARSTVSTVEADPLPRALAHTGSYKAEGKRFTKGGGTIRVFAALAWVFTGYFAALFTGFAAPDLITNLGVRAIEYGGPHKSSPALDEPTTTLRHDLKAALVEVAMAKERETEWMRVFAEDDSKAVALSRELDASRKEVADYIAALNSMRSEILEAKTAATTAEVKIQELTLAISVERDRAGSLTRDLQSVREELITRGAIGTAAPKELLEEGRTAEPTGNEGKRKLGSAVPTLDQLQNPSPRSANSGQVRTSALAAPEIQKTSASLHALPRLVPEGWHEVPTLREGAARVFASPNGNARLRVGHVPARLGRREEDIDRLMYHEGETITYQRRGGSWLAVSGYRNGEIFYRKSNLACRGTRWHTIDMQYPREAKKPLDPIVTGIARRMGDFGSDCG